MHVPDHTGSVAWWENPKHHISMPVFKFLSSFAHLSRAVACALVAAVVATTLGSVARTPAVASTSPSSSVTVFCGLLHRITVTGKQHSAYFVRNDNFGRQPECLSNLDHWPNFTVTVSGAHSRTHVAEAYPEIVLGCVWGACTPHSGLPRRVDRLGTPETSWRITAHAAGLWDAGYDIWFSRHEHISGQDRGAEIMIWIKSTFGSPPAQKAWLVRIGGVRYWFEHWTARSLSGTGRWHYILFRRFRAASRVRSLHLMPFFRYAEHMRLLDGHWWMTSLNAGFEIWRGGRGLATDSFWARP